MKERLKDKTLEGSGLEKDSVEDVTATPGGAIQGAGAEGRDTYKAEVTSGVGVGLGSVSTARGVGCRV